MLWAASCRIDRMISSAHRDAGVFRRPFSPKGRILEKSQRQDRGAGMTPHIPKYVSTWLIDWTLISNSPPRDPNDDDGEEDEEDEEDEDQDEEPPVVREPDE
jgi:hypothetical protein